MVRQTFLGGISQSRRDRASPMWVDDNSGIAGFLRFIQEHHCVSPGGWEEIFETSGLELARHSPSVELASRGGDCLLSVARPRIPCQDCLACQLLAVFVWGVSSSSSSPPPVSPTGISSPQLHCSLCYYLLFLSFSYKRCWNTQD